MQGKDPDLQSDLLLFFFELDCIHPVKVEVQIDQGSLSSSMISSAFRSILKGKPSGTYSDLLRHRTTIQLRKWR